MTGSRIGQRYPVMSKRQYAAAKQSRLSAWVPVDQNPNEIIAGSSPRLRARVRQLVRDFPYFARAVNVLVDYTVGTGTNFQSRVLNADWQPGGGQSKFDRKICQQIEDAVAWWMDEADASGKLHFSELERLAKRQDVETGESLYVKTRVKDPRRYIPYALQAYEADWLTEVRSTAQGNNKIEQGVEYDTATGQVVAYHFSDPWGFGPARRIPAEYVLHGYDIQRPTQLRGVSPFVTAVLIAGDLDDYVSATIDTAKMAAKYLAMVETTDIAGFQRARGVTSGPEDADKKIEHLENAIIEYLRPGEKISFAKNDNPGQTFEPFTKFVLQMVAIATGVPYTLLSGNYQGTNYTTLRGERQDLIKVFAPHCQRHIRHFSQPAVREAIDQAVLAGKLTLPGYWNNPRRYWRSVFIPPGMEPVDPLRESKANRDDIAAGLRSPQEIVARRGRDIEEVLDEIAEFMQMAGERGVAVDAALTDTSLATAPSALGATERRLTKTITDALETAEMLQDEQE